MEVFVGNDLERALKKFKRQVMKDGILQEVRLRRAYEKPGEKRRRKQKIAMEKRAKWERRARDGFMRRP